MKKIYLLLLALPLFSIGCASQPHRSEASPTRLENGNTQIQVKLHDDDVASEGTSINAYAQLCKPVYSKDRESLRCTKKLIGQGRVVTVAPNKLSLIEFGPDARINAETLFEVASKDEGQ